MRRVLHLLTTLLLFAPCHPILAADPVPIRQAVEDFLRMQVKAFPGKTAYSIGPIDAERLTGVCDGYDVSMETGARPWGKTRVAVRCRGGSWKLSIPVKLSVVAGYLVAARSVKAGQTLVEEDIREQTGEISDLPDGVLTARDQALGRTAIGPLATGRPLRADMLRQATVVQAGQSVKVVGTGSGFQVSNEGKALGSAVVGQVVQVRLNSGQILSGLARADGSVEIRF